MAHDVGVTVALQARPIDVDPTQHEPPAGILAEGMDIETLADPKAHGPMLERPGRSASDWSLRRGRPRPGRPWLPPAQRRPSRRPHRRERRARRRPGTLEGF